jgi:hypothetical protein
MKILHLNQNKKWIPVEKRYYKDEAHLQNLLADDVNILPLDDLGYGTPFVTIGKEVGLENGSLDLLAVSPEGHIALIETKLDKNPEVKRTVVGQILGYASYLWNKTYEELENNYFRKFLIQQKINFTGTLADYIKEKIVYPDFSEIDFKAGIEKRLRLGSFSLLIVVDQVNQELKNIANYLNDRTGQEIDFYVAEMELIGDKDEQFLIPRLANPLRKNVTYGQDKSKNDDYDRTPIAKEEFLQKLSVSSREFAERLIEEFEDSEKVKMAWRKNGFSLMTPFSKGIIKPGGYSNFSYLFFQIDSKGAKLTFGYPNEQYDKYKQTHPFIEKYVKYYRSIKGYENGKIDDLDAFNNLKIQELILNIKSTSEKLTKE